MATLQETIEVEVPVSTAYNQWTQFESFPEFMKGVESVEQIDETSLHFRTDIAGVRREYNAQITEQLPDRRIAWVSTDKPRNAGEISFESLGPEHTRVTVALEWEPEGLVEKAGSAVGAVSHQLSADLKRFKHFIESRGIETGAWRSAVDHGEVEETEEEAGFAANAPAHHAHVSEAPGSAAHESHPQPPHTPTPSPKRPAGVDPFIDDAEPSDPS
ncbi:cyclase [Arthrobacter sp. Leaf337]|uniref:SRPBCC family protein n=1 Tax=unclassified Arthrobacter TaxID=235627 RepID=UPI0006FA57C7|nr:SRPBCC family protein [Arthrobacter sp. Leaf337]KQR75227.1 cyclase [Arthrobacter sp. Leaf337]